MARKKGGRGGGIRGETIKKKEQNSKNRKRKTRKCG